MDTQQKDVFSGHLSFKSGEPRFFVFTSGTTHLPKIILTGHIGFLSSLVLFEKALLQVNQNSNFLIAFNFAFSPTIPLYYAAFFLESKIIVCEKKDFLSTPELKKIISQEKIDQIVMPPSFLDKVTHRISVPLRIAFTGEKINRARWLRFKKCFPNAELINVYGLAETMALLVTMPIKVKISSFGKSGLLRLFPGVRYKITNADKQGIGKLWIKNLLPSLCVGYLHKRQDFLRNFSADASFFDTKDLAREKNKYVEIIGRSDSLIKIKGRYLEPNIIERAVKRIKGITAAKVLCLDDNIYLFVQGEKSKSKEATIEKKIRKRVGSYARPDAIYFVREFPKTGSGKVSERLLWKCAKES